MAKPPAFQFYPKDFLADTAHLSPLEIAAYTRLLCFAWVGIAGHRQAHLPNDDTRLASLAGLSADDWQRVRSGVVELFEDRGSELVSKRLSKERDAQEIRRKRLSKRGKEAAKKRWSNSKNGNSLDASGTPHAMHGDGSASALRSRSSVSPLRSESLRDSSLRSETADSGNGQGSLIPIEDYTIQTSASVHAALMAWWLRQYRIQPDERTKGRNAAVAQRIVEGSTVDQIKAAVQGIERLFPHSNGEPWDLFTLEKKMGLAIAKADVNLDARRQIEAAEMEARTDARR